jgi:hypothetical protein
MERSGTHARLYRLHHHEAEAEARDGKPRAEVVA